MSIIKTIYNAPIMNTIIDDQYGEVSVHIKYNGKFYRGFAQLHPQDAAFFSERVGKTIATSKARIKILKYEYQRAKIIYNYKWQYYREVQGYGKKTSAEIDPTGAFFHNVLRAKSNVDTLYKALKKEQKNLQNYLQGHAKAIASIRRLREKRSEDESN